jgi:RloB-like protein
VTPRRHRVRRPQVIVFTEGEATEVSYVDAIKRLQDTSAVRVDDRHGAPSFLVPLAIAEKQRLARLSRDDGTSEDEVLQVWCMFDRDQHPNVDALIRQATDAGVRVAFSHPCFELWLLVHFRQHGAPAAGVCAGLVDAVNTHIAGYRDRGKRVRLSDLVGHYAQAREQARRLGDQHERDGILRPTERDPSTSVWEFVDMLGIKY